MWGSLAPTWSFQGNFEKDPNRAKLQGCFILTSGTIWWKKFHILTEEMRVRLNKKLFLFNCCDFWWFSQILTTLNQIRRAQHSLHALLSLVVIQDHQFDPGCWSIFSLLSFSTFLWTTIQRLACAWNYTCRPIRRETEAAVGGGDCVNHSISMTGMCVFCLIMNTCHSGSLK